MADNLLLDTSILIDYLRTHQPTIVFVDELLLSHQGKVGISAISEFELYIGKSLDKPEEKQKVDFLIDQFYIYSINSKILRQAGEIKRHHSISVGDAIIAATAIQENLILITDDSDFSKIPNLDSRLKLLKTRNI